MDNKIKKVEEKQKIFDEIKFLMVHLSTYEKLKFLSFIPLNIFKHLFYLLSMLIPRRKDIWIFGSWKGERFFDNSKYMFLFMSNNHKKEITPIWLSKNKEIIKKLKEENYNVYHTFSLKGMYYNLMAKYIISDTAFNSVNFWCCGGATKIQLWHGLMLKNQGKHDKKLPWKRPLGKLIYRYFDPWLFTKNDYIMCSSDFFIDKFATTFDVDNEKIIVTGFSRNDVIFKHIKGENLIDPESFDKMNKLRLLNPNSKIILYMPTFRDKDFFSRKSPDFGQINFLELEKFLEEVDGYFILKPHPDINTNIKNQGRIVVIPSNFDIYPFLSQIDILIADYSSVYFDFLLVNKPIIFYPYDLDEYVKDSRGLMLNYEDFTPGPKAFTFKDLLYWIDYFVKGNDEFIPKRKKIMDLSFNHIDGNSSERIYDYIYNLK